MKIINVKLYFGMYWKLVMFLLFGLNVISFGIIVLFIFFLNIDEYMI